MIYLDLQQKQQLKLDSFNGYQTRVGRFQLVSLI